MYYYNLFISVYIMFIHISLNRLGENFDIVVNCCGINAVELCQDQSTYPVMGHIIMVKEKSHVNLQIPVDSFKFNFKHYNNIHLV